MKRQFCENCMSERECTYKEKKIKELINNKEIEYIKKYYVCNTCGNDIYGDLLDDNIISANRELRKNNNIITTEEINEILDKYCIGKKPLSLVLRLGEINIIRYLNGSNPTREISDLLKNISNNPFLYELYLLAAKDDISPVAYKKSLGRTKQLELTSSNSKLYNSALYIIKSQDEIDPLSIQKNLFFAYGFSDLFLKNKLFGDLPEAWRHGPVYKEIYDCFSYYKSENIDYSEIIKNIDINLSEEERMYLDEIIRDFGCYSGPMLRKMTHLTEPWINARKGLQDEEPSNRVISDGDINSYFKKVYDEYDMHNINDISKYSTNLFNEARK